MVLHSLLDVTERVLIGYSENYHNTRMFYLFQSASERISWHFRHRFLRLFPEESILLEKLKIRVIIHK
ncbi:hypothetical protein D3OALGA1CA_618 [Olavius algarvensis associated proteobacterium Delta 3]|nr:hypothetical protein D3OALGA1CA_618 [Olavius algarvensis associated proteobacterium Delta 3]CAB5114503.1 hypothetical protein D3OALGB2SA_2596 [Olavius algarvensis associated proteobacterium Delta 3]